MIFSETELPGAYLIETQRHEDERGFFARIFSDDEFRDIGVEGGLAQWSISYNRRRHTLRGMHWQADPHAETKLVRCVRGSIFDVIVDLRESSPTFRRWIGVELDDVDRRGLLVPAGFAHGFQTLADDTEVLYGISPRHVPDAARGFRFDDPSVAIAWPPAPKRIISERDRGLPLLSAAA